MEQGPSQCSGTPRPQRPDRKGRHGLIAQGLSPSVGGGVREASSVTAAVAVSPRPCGLGHLENRTCSDTSGLGHLTAKCWLRESFGKQAPVCERVCGRS